MRDPDHPSYDEETRRRLRLREELAAADLMVAEAWLDVDADLQLAARRAARRDQAVVILTYGTLAAFWALVILLAVAVLR